MDSCTRAPRTHVPYKAGVAEALGGPVRHDAAPYPLAARDFELGLGRRSTLKTSP